MVSFPLQSGVQLLYLWCAIIYGNEEFKVLTEVEQNKTAATEQTSSLGELSNTSHIFNGLQVKTGLLQSNCTPRILHLPLRSQLSAQKGDLEDQKGGRSLHCSFFCGNSRARSLAIGHYSVFRPEKRRVEEDEQHKREVIVVCALNFTNRLARRDP